MSKYLAELEAAKAEVKRLELLIEQEAALQMGYEPTRGQHYYMTSGYGSTYCETHGGARLDEDRVAHGVFKTEQEALIEALFRRLRRYGARVTGPEARELWVWSPLFQEGINCVEIRDEVRPEFIALNLLAGSTFRTKEHADKYGRDVLPKIVEELLGDE